MESIVAVRMLSALGQEARLGIFRLLMKSGAEGVAAGAIARRLKVPPNSLSANLNVLSHAGLVTSRREGRSILYAANYGAMSGLLGFLMEDCCDGAPEVCAPLSGILAQAETCATACTQTMDDAR